MNKQTFNYISSHTAEELCRANSKEALINMYRGLYKIEPRGTAKKIDLAYSCKYFVDEQIRTDDLTKILR